MEKQTTKKEKKRGTHSIKLILQKEENGHQEKGNQDIS
jgi:hypothetical protein